MYKNIFAIVTMMSATSVSAEVCDYRLSSLAGKKAATTVVAGSAGTAAAGIGLKAAGFYTLVHAGSGLTMVGSTAAGASAAGTTGIIAGTAGALGTVTAVILSPVVLIGGAIVAVGTAGFEGVCYFSDERITDQAAVEEIVRNIASNDPQKLFLYDENAQIVHIASKILDDGTIVYAGDGYKLSKLMILNGDLVHKDWGPNTNLGRVGFTKTSDE